MTTVIDERVVEMRFNNADFEKNVAQSMKTLDSLKKSLDFDSAKSLENLGKASKNFSLDGITSTITEATTKFSALEIAGITAIMNITNKAVDFGIKFAKSLSIDQVTEGFDKYATKTQAVQTIMAATADQFTNQADQMAYVNEQLDKLTWFTDETSYNMIDMTSNIGKFVSNNIPLEQAVTAMEGIATWAGLSGASTNEASRAMYNFSQAIGAGAMKLQDWKSIENANMATAKFKQTALETAVEMGRLKKAGEDLYTTLDGKTEVSVENFSESLKKKWFDTDVMTETLGKFGNFADELYRLSDATGLTASELLESLDQYKEGTLDITELANECQVSVSDLNAEFARLSGEGFELGKKAFAASQEAKTFTEAIVSVKDAVSSGWMNTFELVFGNYLEAKKLWTGLANSLYDMFAEGGNKRNEVLAVWKELGGRNSLIMGAVNAINLLIKPIEAIKKAFESVLPRGKEFGKILNQLTYRFYIFTSKLQPSQAVLDGIYEFFKGVFSIGKSVIGVINSLIKAISPAAKPIKSIVDLLGKGLRVIGIVLQVISLVIDNCNIVTVVVTVLSGVLKTIFSVIKTLATILGGVIITALTKFVGLVSKAGGIVNLFVSAITKLVSIVGGGLASAFSKVTSLFKGFNKEEKVVGSTMLKAPEKLKGLQLVLFKVKEAIGAVKDKLAGSHTILEKFIVILNTVKNVILTIVGGTILGAIMVFVTLISKAQIIITKFTSVLKTLGSTVGSGISNAFNKISSIFKSFNIEGTRFGDVIEKIKNKFKSVADFFSKIGTAIRTSVLDFLNAKTFIEKFQIALAGIKNVITTVIGGAMLGGISVFTGAISLAQKAISKLSSTVSKFTLTVGTKFSSAFSKISNFLARFTKSGEKSTTVVKKMEENYGSAGIAAAQFGTISREVGEEVKKNETILDRFKRILLNARDVFISAGKTIGISIIGLGKNIITFFADFKTRFAEATKNAKTAIDFLKGIGTIIGTYLADAWTKFKEFLATFDIDFTTFKTGIESITTALGNFIDKLGPGRIVAFAFATAMLALIGAVVKLSDAFKSTLGAVSGLFNNVNKILKKQFAKSSVVTDLAKAFAILAASLALLTFVDQDALDHVANVMLKLMVVFSLCAAALRVLDILLNKFVVDTDFKFINANLLALAGSMVLLVAAFAVLNTITLADDWMTKLKVMGLLLLEFVAAAGILSRIAPALSKGSILLLSLALSMKIMVDSLAKLGEKDITGSSENLKAFTVLFLGVAAMAAAAGKLKLTSALNLILIAKALEYLLPVLSATLVEISPYLTIISEKINDLIERMSTIKEKVTVLFEKLNGFFRDLWNLTTQAENQVIATVFAIGGFVTVIAGFAAVIAGGFALAALIKAIGSLGNILKGAGLAVIGLAIAFNLITEAIQIFGDYIKDMEEEQFDRIMKGFTHITLVMAGAIALIAFVGGIGTLLSKLGPNSDGKTLRTSFIGIALALVALAYAMKIIVKVMEDMKGWNEAHLDHLAKLMMGLLACVGVAAAGAGQIKKGLPVLVGLIAICTTLAVVIALVGVFSAMWTPENEKGLKVAIAVVTGFLVLIGALTFIVGKFTSVGKSLSTLMPILGMLLTISGVLITLSAMNTDWRVVAATLGGMMGVIVIVGALIFTISKIKLSKTKIPLLVTITIMIATLMGEIIALSWAVNKYGAGKVLGSLVILLGIIIELQMVLVCINSISFTGIGKKVAMMATVTGALMIFAAMVIDLARVITVLGNNVAWAMGAFLGIVVMFGAIIGFLAKLKIAGGKSGQEAFIKKLGLLAAVTIALIAVASALGRLTIAIGSNHVGAALAIGSMLGAMGVLVKVMDVITKIQVTKSIWTKIGLLGSCILALIAIAKSLGDLTIAIGSNHIGAALSTGGIIATLLILTKVMELITKIQVSRSIWVKIALLESCVLALVGVAYAIKLVAEQEAGDATEAFTLLGVSMAGLLGVMLALEGMGKLLDMEKLGGIIALAITVVGAVGAFAYSLYQLAQLDVSKLEAASNAMTAIMGPLAKLAIVLAIVQVALMALGAGLGGTGGAIIGIVALPGVIVAIGLAFIAMGYGLELAANAIDKMTTALERVAPALKDFEGIEKIDFATIADGMVDVAIAGFAMGAAAGSVEAFASAMGHFKEASGGGSLGPKGVTWEKIPESYKQSADTMVETAETTKVKMVETNEEMVVEATSGVLSKKDDYQNAVGKTFTIEDDQVAKVAQANEQAQKKMLDLKNYEYDALEIEAKNAGYKSAVEYWNATHEGHIDGINRINGNVIGQQYKEKVDNVITSPAVESAKEKATNMIEEIGIDTKNGLDGVSSSVSSWMTEMYNKFSTSGSIIGKVFGGNIAYNMMQIISKAMGSFNWMFNQELNAVSQYGANGMPSNVIEKYYDVAGKGASAYTGKLSALAKVGKGAGDITGWLSDNFKWLGENGLDLSNIIEDNVIPSIEGVGDASGKSGKGVKDFADSLRSGLDLFSKFEVKNETTSEQLLENMKSNIDGYASWSHRMTVLAKRFTDAEIPVTLLEKLQEDGPKQQDTMNAIYNMTDEQLQQLRELWETGTNLPESQAAIIGDAFTYMGEMASQGFSNALDEHDKAHAAAHGLGEAAVKGLKESLKVESPSKVTEQIGDFLVQGLALGILSDASTWKLTFAVVRLSDMLVELFNENLAPEKMQVVGETMVQGLFTDALKNMNTENPIITAFANSLMEVGPVLEALTVFVETVMTQLNTAFGMADENSNSEVFYNYGKGGVMGFANGIGNNLGYIHTQIMILGLRVVGWLSDENFTNKFYEVGKNATIGFANGLADSEAANKVLEEAEKIAKAAAEKMASALGEESPSKVTKKIGAYASEGLAIGIKDAAGTVYTAAGEVADGLVDGMTENGRLQDILNDGIDLNPVITPMLDLSILQAQMADLNAMFGARAMSLGGQNGGTFSTETPTQEINFTQNNYSPKALSRIDIYRQTKNQISMMKGAMANA